MQNRWQAGVALSLSLALTACGGNTRPAPSKPAPTARRAPVMLGTFSGTVVPGDIGPQKVELPVARDGKVDLNPPDTIEVFSPVSAVVFAPNTGSCGALRTYEAPVRIKNYLQEELYNVYTEFTSITGGSSRVCNGMASPPANLDFSPTVLNTTFGLLDYTNGDGVNTNGGVHKIGAFDTSRTASAGTIAPNGSSQDTPLGDVTWAFSIPNSLPFTFTAHVYGYIRPRPAILDSPYVDGAATPGEVVVFSFDPPDGVGATGIAERVNVTTFSDANLTTQVDSLTAALDQTVGTGHVPVPGATAALAATGTSFLWVKLQNTWTAGDGTTLLGVNVPDTATPANGTILTVNGGFLVTKAATRGASIGRVSPAPANTAPLITNDSHADGADVEIWNTSGIIACNTARGTKKGVATYIWNTGDGNPQPPVTNFPLTDPGNPSASWVATPDPLGLVTNTVYCYRVRNVFTGIASLNPYMGTWSLYGSFKAP